MTFRSGYIKNGGLKAEEEIITCLQRKVVGSIYRKIYSSSLCCPQKRYTVFFLAHQCNVHYFYAEYLSETLDPKFILEDTTQAAQSNQYSERNQCSP